MKGLIMENRNYEDIGNMTTEEKKYMLEEMRWEANQRYLRSLEKMQDSVNELVKICTEWEEEVSAIRKREEEDFFEAPKKTVKYVHELDEEETKDLKKCFNFIFGIEDMDSFAVMVDKNLVVNKKETPVFCEPGSWQMKTLSSFIKYLLDAEWLSMPAVFFDGKKLLCYSYTTNKQQKKEDKAVEEIKEPSSWIHKIAKKLGF